MRDKLFGIIWTTFGIISTGSDFLGIMWPGFKGVLWPDLKGIMVPGYQGIIWAD